MTAYEHSSLDTNTSLTKGRLNRIKLIVNNTDGLGRGGDGGRL